MSTTEDGVAGSGRDEAVRPPRFAGLRATDESRGTGEV